MRTPSPIAVGENFSSSNNAHRVIRQGSGVLILEPDFSELRTGLGTLLLSPVIYFLVRRYSSDHQLLVWGTIVPWLGGVPLIIMSLVSRIVGTCVRFDRNRGEIRITGLRFGKGIEYAVSDIREIQFCSGGIIHARKSGSWKSFQLNLLVNRDGEISHVNLLNSGGQRQLRNISRTIAEFLEIPFYDDTQKPPPVS